MAVDVRGEVGRGALDVPGEERLELLPARFRQERRASARGVALLVQPVAERHPDVLEPVGGEEVREVSVDPYDRAVVVRVERHDRAVGARDGTGRIEATDAREVVVRPDGHDVADVGRAGRVGGCEQREAAGEAYPHYAHGPLAPELFAKRVRCRPYLDDRVVIDAIVRQARDLGCEDRDPGLRNRLGEPHEARLVDAARVDAVNEHHAGGARSGHGLVAIRRDLRAREIELELLPRRRHRRELAEPRRPPPSDRRKRTPAAVACVTAGRTRMSIPSISATRKMRAMTAFRGRKGRSRFCRVVARLRRVRVVVVTHRRTI